MSLKKILYVCIVCFMFVGISGCKNNGEEQETEQTAIGSVADGQTDSEEEIPKPYDTITDISQFTQVKESQEFNIETDFQYFIDNMNGSGCQGMAENDDSIIYYSKVNIITLVKIFDKKSQTVQFFCNKPECSHNDKSCNGYFGEIRGIFYYKGYVYMMIEEVQEDTKSDSRQIMSLNLYKVSMDGQVREKVGNLVNTVISDEVYKYGIAYIQHRGYLYFVYSIGTGEESTRFYNNGSNSIYRINIDEMKDKECIANLNRDGNYQFTKMQACGSYVYYMLTDGEGMGEAYRFNTESLKSEAINIGTIAIENFVVWKGAVYYKKDWKSNEIYRYNPDTGKEELFVNTEKSGYKNSRNMEVDENYMYVYCFNDNESNIEGHRYVLFDETGNNKAEINIEIARSIDRGGRDYYFSFVSPEGTNTDDEMYLVDKSLIGTGDYSIQFKKAE